MAAHTFSELPFALDAVLSAGGPLVRVGTDEAQPPNSAQAATRLAAKPSRVWDVVATSSQYGVFPGSALTLVDTVRREAERR